jgi:hypothetical protein
MAESIGRLGVAAVVAVILAGCADARMSDSGSAPTPTGYGISSDAGSHGSVYSWLFGSNNPTANQSVADARAATPAASSATAVPARPATRSPASSPTVAPSQQAALAAPATADVTPPTAGAYGIPSDAGSHGSLYSYLFGQNGKPSQVASGPAVPLTSYGIPADAGSHGSLYSLLFGSKDAPATPPNGSAATPTPPPPSQ